jgi:predicted DNA-binding transcriptional regulator AlpA
MMTFDTNLKTRVLCAKDVAAFLGKSVDWVYDHAEEIGGVKRGGSWFFPNEEDIYVRLFQGRERVPVRFHGKGKAPHQGVVQDETGRKSGGSRKKKGSKTTVGNGSPGRHGLA